MLSTFPSGLAIDRYSVRHLLLFSVLLLSTASILLPLCADFMGPVAVVCLRFLMGFGEGMMIPGINGMITGWIPLHEKSTAASLFTSGNQLAGIMGNPMSAELCASSLRWPAVFYFSGNSLVIYDFFCSFSCSNLLRDYGKYDACLDTCLYSCLFQGCIISRSQTAMVLMSVCFFLLAQTANCSTHGLALFFLCAICASFGLSISGFLTSLLSIAPNYIGTMSSINQMIAQRDIFGVDVVGCLGYTHECVCLGLSCIIYFPSPVTIFHKKFFLRFAGRVATPQLITYFKSTGTAEEWKGILVVYSVMTFVSAVVFLIWGSGDIQPWNNPSKELDAENIASPFMDKSVLLEQETIN
uniref:MFS domain-containing protein n=1 Tax=Heterorhabditis bacteriophora TaxID=37862 RepID=A0A1I7XP14_HETBA